jgi:hypothetical protein
VKRYIRCAVKNLSDESANVAAKAAKGHNLRELTQLASDNRVTVRRALASNPNTPAEVLDKLADDTRESVLSTLAANPNTPAETLQKIAKNPSLVGYTVHALADNPNVTPEIFISLARHPDECIRGVLAGITFSKLPAEAVNLLGRDPDDFVRQSLLRNRVNNCSPTEREFAWWAKDPSPRISCMIARRTKSPELLKRLSADHDADVRFDVAKNKAAPYGLLNKLASDNDKDVQHWALIGIAESAETPTEVLRDLYNKYDNNISFEAYQNLKRRGEL